MALGLSWLFGGKRLTVESCKLLFHEMLASRPFCQRVGQCASFQDGGEERWESLLKSGTHAWEQLFGARSRTRSTERRKTWSGFRHGAKTSPAHLLHSPPILHDRCTYGPHFTEGKNKALVREKHHGEKERPEDLSPQPHSGSPAQKQL